MDAPTVKNNKKTGFIGGLTALLATTATPTELSLWLNWQKRFFFKWEGYLEIDLSASQIKLEKKIYFE